MFHVEQRNSTQSLHRPKNNLRSELIYNNTLKRSSAYNGVIANRNAKKVLIILKSVL